MNLIPPKVHGFVDLAFAVITFALPRGLGWSSRIRSVLTLVGGFTVLYSLITRYPMGLFKLLPFRGHLVLDGLVALFLGGFQFLVTEEETSVRGAVGALGLFGLLVALLTGTGKADTARPGSA